MWALAQWSPSVGTRLFDAFFHLVQIITMNDPSAQQSMPPTIVARDQLPPVQPPAASFIIQLFLIPLLIVSIIVGVWMMFSWLAQSESPEELVRDIERLNHSSWQQALTLAQQLRDPARNDLRQNTQLAQQLSDLLEKQVSDGKTGAEFLNLRMFLCRALGEFEVDAGLHALAKAAITEKQVEESDVRHAALQAIGVLVGRLKPAHLDEFPDVLDAVIKGTHEFAEQGDERLRRETLRSTATFSLGVLPGEQATERLAELLNDPSLDVAYNAAIGLARRGDERSLPLLGEMLNPPEEALIDPDRQLSESERQAQRQWKHMMVVGNGLRAIGKMYADHPTANLGDLPAAVARIAEDDSVPGTLQMQASEVVRLLGRGAVPVD